MSLGSFAISFSIADPEWSNRLLHALGGGFVAFFVCFLVARDSQIDITRFQFFVFSFLLVTAFGVGNEILEFAIQHYLDLTFARDVADTWLDLVSNTVGVLVAAAIMVPFIHKT